METESKIVKELKQLDDMPECVDKKEMHCVVAMSDDHEIKVAVVKSKVPKVYEVMQFEKIDDCFFKERVHSQIVYGRKKTAQLVMQILNGEVVLNGRQTSNIH